MDKDIKQSIEEFLELIKKEKIYPRIEFIVLYGSSLSDYFYKDSDIDICIYIVDEEKELAKIRLNLLKKLNEKFDIQIFQLLPIYVQIEILKCKFLYMRDEFKVYKIANDTIEEFEDFYPFYLDYINEGNL